MLEIAIFSCRRTIHFPYVIDSQKFILSCAVIDLGLGSDTTGDVVEDTAAIILRSFIVLVILGKIIHASSTNKGFFLRLVLIDLDLLLLSLLEGFLGSLARAAIDVALEDAACLLDTSLDGSLSALRVDDGLESLFGVPASMVL